MLSFCPCRMETNRGAYHLTSYYIAKTLSTWPWEILFTFCYSAIVYFMVGYQVEAGKVFIYWVVLIVFQLISEEMGLVSALTNPLIHNNIARSLRGLSQKKSPQECQQIAAKHEKRKSQCLNRQNLWCFLLVAV